MGAGLSSLSVAGRPALSSGSGRPDRSPFALGMNLLIPFSNRISGGGFTDDRGFHSIPSNLAGEPVPIHGDAFQQRWEVLHHEAGQAHLYLREGGIGPFRYDAEVQYRLFPASLEVKLELTSRSDSQLPWGLGFHPWFPRTPATRLRFRAEGFWPQDDRHLPATSEAQSIPQLWDFTRFSPLPEEWINAAFSGWDGEAEILQDQTAIPLRLSANGLGTLIVYSPSAAAPFVCIEPVSHPVDAHNLPGRPGLVNLGPHESLSAALVLTWDPPPDFGDLEQDSVTRA